jgi:DNA modification methylase
MQTGSFALIIGVVAVTAHQRKADAPIAMVERRALGVAVVTLSRLKPYARNPRRGNVEAIKESLEQNGQYRPIVVNRPTMEVLAGNHTLLAAEELGWSEIAVTFVDVDPDRAKRIVLADNRTNDLAAYDDEALAELLLELPSLEGTGYDQAALDELLDELAPPPLEEEEVPAAPAEPRTRPGDLYELGPHRLICADAREPSTYDRLLGGERPRLVWTDPPYGVSYEGKTRARLRIQYDGGGGLRELLEASFAAIDAALAPGAPLYVAAPGGPLGLTFGAAFCEAGWLLRQTLVWVKDAMVLGRSDYHYAHEQILYGYKPGPGRLGRGGRGWHGDDSQTTVLEFDRPRASREHPTMKPPELVESCLRNSSRRREAVLDPFAGSGSTLIACERAGRRARLVELDPGYCDVICARYERLTDRTARLLGGAGG